MELAEIIKKMDELRDELDSLRPIPTDRINRLNQKLRLDWNYHSNSIEGNTLTASETKAFILHGITAKGKPFRDYIEMRGHNDALKKLEEIVHHDLKITENLVKEFHKIILVEPYSGEAEINPGEYKTQANYLYSTTGERIDFEPPQEVPRLMNELINWLNNHIDPPKRKKKKYDLHPLLIASGFHVRFIQIHPFGDGNGRMARILMNLILMLCGYVPAVIRLENRKTYYSALNLSSLDNTTLLAEFIGEECIKSLEIAVKAAKGESIEEVDDFDKEIELLKRKQAKPKEYVLKTKQIMRETIGNVYCPLIKQLNDNLIKLTPLFSDCSWNYFKEPEPPKYGIPMVPTFCSNNELINHFNTLLNNRDDSYHHFKASYWLMQYNDQNDFSIEVSLKIIFDEYAYKIEAFIGQPYAGSTMTKGIAKLVNMLNKEPEAPFNTFKDYILFKTQYNEVVSNDAISSLAKQISSETLAYIKQKVSEK